MKKRIFFVAAAALALLATACSKDNDEAASQTEVRSIPITLTANYGNGSKVTYTDAVNGNVTAKWDTEDKIIVCYDGYTSELTLNGGAGTATATFTGSISYSAGHEPNATTCLVCYVKDKNVTHSEVTVNGNGNWIYTDEAFKGQDGTLGGAAKLNLYYGAAFYGNGNITCNFSVNTSLMKFTLTNIGGDQGEAATLAYMSGSTEMAKASFRVANADNNDVWLSIPASAYSGVQKLVYKCGDNTKERVLSEDHANFVAGKTYSKAVRLPAPDAPEGAINGIFSVSPTKQVWFSKGNLQAVFTVANSNAATSYSWRFAEHQYDCIGNATANTDISGNGKVSKIGTVDLFGWSTSRTKFGIHNSDGNSYSGNFIDWGTNVITNGGGWANQWRTLTSAEWDYLLNDENRTPTRFARAKVNNVTGLIIFPDSYTHPSGLTLTKINSAGAAYTSNTYSSSQWAQMEANGAVFLPAAGARNATNVNNTGIFGFYWSSSACDDAAQAYAIYISLINIDAQDNNVRWKGMSVRLVQDY